jgi:DNA-binding NtrC family response regulator
MSLLGRTIFIISADPAVTAGCLHELTASSARYQMRTAASLKQAFEEFHHYIPAVIFLDESAVNPANESVESAVALLTEAAPVVVAAGADCEPLLKFLISSGAADFVKREGRFLPAVSSSIERHRHSRQHRVATGPPRPVASCRRRAPRDHRWAGRALARNRAPPLECLGGRTSRDGAACLEQSRKLMMMGVRHQ